MLPVQQGGIHLKHEDQGDAAIRICNAVRCEIIGLQTVPWLDRDGSPWKQDVQLRPTSSLFILRDCKVRLVDIGDIRAHYDRPRPVSEVQFINCDLKRDPHYTPGAKKVKFIDTKVGGAVTNKTLSK
jgi:hypothetical protein